MNARPTPPLPARGLAVALLLALAGACGQEPEPFDPPSFQVVGPPALVGGECPSAVEATYGPLSFPDVPPSTVRLTYLQPGASSDDADARLLCDIVVGYDAPPPVVAVPSESPVDVAVEFFSATGELLAAGLAREVDLSGAVPVTIPAAPLGEFSCASDHLGIARAFHSAVALPDGRVLISGGVTAAYDDPSVLDVDNNSGMYLTDAVEIYDPATGRFTRETVPGLTARALHTSSAWTDGADIVVALVGGFTLSDPSQPAIVPNQGGMRWTPAIQAQGVASEVLIISPDGSIARDGTDDVPAVLAGHSAIVGDRQIHAGGQAWVTDPMTLETEPVGVDSFSATDTTSWMDDVLDTPLLQPRRGASVTQLGGGRALVWGGHMEADVTQVQPFLGEILTGLNGQNLPTSVQIAAYTGTPATPRALHQAVPLGDDILIVGGFHLDTALGLLRVTADPLLERLTVDRQDLQVNVAPVTMADGAAPTQAGHLGVAALASGDVLITGGNPRANYGVCNQAQDGIFCSLPDSYLVRADGTALEPTRAPLVRSRYGHQAVDMGDGLVLVTGGVHAPAPEQALYMVDEVELIDTRRADADTLSPGLSRAPAQVATGADGAPLAACRVIENVAPAQ